jgi:hypothetical protein
MTHDSTALHHLSGVAPSAHLVHLKSLPQIPLEQRRDALRAWVAWVNAHRQDVGQELAGRLLAALDQLSAAERPGIDGEGLQRQFDDWLEVAGRAGVGRGPDAKL